MVDQYKQPGGSVITPTKGAPLIKRRRGPIIERPTAASVPEGFQYYAEDQDGGQEYEKHNGLWVKRGPAVNDSNPKLLDKVELAATFGSGNIASGTDTDIGLQLTIESGIRPLKFRAVLKLQPQLGSAASPQVIRNQAKLFEQVAGVWTPRDVDTRAVKVATGEAYFKGFLVEWVAMPPADNTVYPFKVTVNTNIANSAFVVFGRNTGASSFIECVEL